MMSINPKEHPTFQRAMHLAQAKLLGDKPALRAKIDGIIDNLPMPRDEAVSLALGEVAQAAYEDAIEELSEQCAARARIEFICSGHAYLDDLRRQVLRVGDGESALSSALEDARSTMPEMVATIHEFGIREDGLIFGRTYNEAIGGNFSTFQKCIMEALGKEALGQGSSGNSLAAAVTPSLQSMAQRSFPSESRAASGRSLCTHVEELAARLRTIPNIIFSFGSEPRHSISGDQAAARLAQIAESENSLRPNGRAISHLFMELGV